MNKEIVVLGGGTGTFTVLSGLKKHNVNLTAIVSMADDGGSTGTLRTELGVLPPGDVRQCLVALSGSDELMNQLMNHRFTDGCLSGHNFGNILLSALEQTTGSFDKAVSKASAILNIKGSVIPVTLEKINLMAKLKNGITLSGEHEVDTQNLSELEKLYLEPQNPKANPKAIKAIQKADIIVIGPGDIYTSILPDLLVPDIRHTIKTSNAPKMFICNLMNKPIHTKNFSVLSFLDILENTLNTEIDYVIFNTATPPKELYEIYKQDEQETVQIDLKNIQKRAQNSKTKFFGGNLLSQGLEKTKDGDKMIRSLVRHNPKKLAEFILSIS
jgi:uncharacterized cofD-like protein